MSQHVETPTKSATASSALAMYRRVAFDGSTGKVGYAGAGVCSYGTCELPAYADGDPTSIRLRTAMGTRKMVAAGAIAKGAQVYGAANGKIDDTVTPAYEGVALEAAGADGDVIEVAYIPQASGLKVVAGQQTTVAASDTIVTGLATVVAAVASLDSDPVDDPEWVSASIGDQAGSPTAGSFYLKTWKNTAGNDPTPTAATTFGKKVNWIAFGY